MRLRLTVLALLVMALLLGTSVASAAPTIVTFTADVDVVVRSELANRTARVPVRWAAVDRPFTANLVFEQVLPDGTFVNVELPRPIQWVASSGQGLAAPILPNDSATEIVLRVRLVGLLNNQVYDEERITLPITNTGGGGDPSITRFSSSANYVNRGALANQTARVPVSWNVANRPSSANLVFEQLLPDGRIINVELPRPVVWVASSGDGIAAPLLPNDTATSIVLRVRLVDMGTSDVYDESRITLPIDDGGLSAPVIRTFSAGQTSVSSTALAQRTARIPVTWAIDNRQDGTNLVFEQVVDGRVVNVELPRPNPYVASEGTGVVAPLLPASANTILLQLRVINLSDNTTLTRAEITLTISDRNAGNTRIVSFTGPTDPVARQATITLRWEVQNAASISIVRLSERGDIFLDTIGSNLNATGSLDYAIPSDYIEEIPFMLQAESASGVVVSEFVRVPIDCPFDESLTDSCPISQQDLQLAYQRFENGWMIWRSDTDEIIVLHSSRQWRVFNDTWVEGQALNFAEAVPTGMIMPQRGFGKLWAENSEIRLDLGWATAEEVGFTGRFETHRSWFGRNMGTSLHFRLPDGRILHLENTWRVES